MSVFLLPSSFHSQHPPPPPLSPSPIWITWRAEHPVLPRRLHPPHLPPLGGIGGIGGIRRRGGRKVVGLGGGAGAPLKRRGPGREAAAIGTSRITPCSAPWDAWNRSLLLLPAFALTAAAAASVDFHLSQHYYNNNNNYYYYYYYYYHWQRLRADCCSSPLHFSFNFFSSNIL